MKGSLKKGQVSIVIPTWNRPKSLRRTLQSIFSQSYKNFEVIVVDDGSEADISEVCRLYPIRKIIRQKHSGANAARNRGFAQSSGELLLFCDDDNELERSYLEKMVQTLKANPDAAFAYCGFEIDGKVFGIEPFDPRRLRQRNYINGTMLIRRSKFPGWDTNVKRLQDWDLILTMIERGERGVLVPEVLFRTTLRNWPRISDDSSPGTLDYAHSYVAIARKHRIPDISKGLEVLIRLYNLRPDLQEAYPEARGGDYRRLITWAYEVASGKILDHACVRFREHASVYEILYTNCLVSERSELTSQIDKLQQYLEEIRGIVSEALSDRNRRIDQLNQEVGQLSTELKRKEERLAHLDNHVDEMNAELEKYKESVPLLEKKSTELYEVIQNMRLSPAWNFIELYRALLDRFAPPQTFARKLVEFGTNRLLALSRLAQCRLTKTLFLATPAGNWLSYELWKEHATKRLLGKVEQFQTRDKSVDVVVTVHNGYVMFRQCIESILCHTRQPYKITIIDDASTDPDLLCYLDTLKALKNVVIFRNPENLGYVRSVNQFLKHSNSDVILLNSDTVVTKDWLDKMHRCAYSNARIATVSPLSNNATICSVPNFCEGSPIPEGFDADTFAGLVEKSSLRRYPPIITSPGFCMFIKKQVLEEIGVFDEDFAPAYEEENDFCIRAFKAGYVAVLDDATFVYHKGEVSYSERASRLKREHCRTMEQKHPGYMSLVRSFVEENPLRDIQERIRGRIIQEYKKMRPSLLYVIHKPIFSGTPGGTELHCLQLVQNLKEYLVYLLFPEGQHLVLQEHSPLGVRRYIYPRPYSEQHCITDSVTESTFDQILAEFSISLVHFQHLLGLPLSLLLVAKDKRLPVVLSLNDFYYLCTQYMLLRDGELYCEVPKDLGVCDSCLGKQFGHSEGFQRSYRNYCRAMIDAADVVTCASRAAVDVYKRAYDMPERKIQIIPHGYAPLGHRNDTYTGKRHKIAFIGSVVASFKGRKTILQLLNINHRPGIEWHFFGVNSDLRPFLAKSDIRPLGKLVFHGEYEREYLPKTLQREGIGLVILPYVQPETFSFVLSEAWSAGIPVIAPDLCALGERIRRNGGGWLYPYGSDAETILKLVYHAVDNEDEYRKRLEEITNMNVPAVPEYLESYRKLYGELLQEGPQNTRTMEMVYD